jgi:Ca2+-binding RTX toxin-like protein
MLLACATLPASASAAGTLEFTDFGDGTTEARFTAGASDVNNVVVSGSDAQITITSAFAIAIAPASSPGCTGDGTTTVVCAGGGIFLDATLGTQPDRIEITADIRTTVSGGEGADTLIGGPGGDVLIGDDDPDTILGNAGDDFLGGGGGDEIADSLFGGPGADEFRLATPDGPDLLDGGAGIDHVTAATGFLLPGFSYTLDDGLANDGATNQGANIVGVEDIDAHESHDFVRGTAGPNVIVTVDGNDVIDGLGGPDLISAGSQDDTVEARDGFSDRILCGSGIDTVSVDQLDVLSDCENVTTTFVEPFGTLHPPPVVPPPAPPPPAPPPAARDTSAPRCTVSAARTIRDPVRAITVTTTCSEPSALLATLTARPPRGGGAAPRRGGRQGARRRNPRPGGRRGAGRL